MSLFLESLKAMGCGSRSFFSCAAIVWPTFFIAPITLAQVPTGTPSGASYPQRPVKIIVPFAPSGPNDLIARIMAQKLGDWSGRAFVVENRGGAGGTIGVDAGLKAPADGYTLIMGGSSNLAVAPSFYKKLPYDSLRDLAFISNCAFVPYVVVVNPRVPAKNIRELVRIAKTRSGFLSYGSSGTGSMSSLAVELMNATMATQITHVPYKGTVPALTDVMTGQIDLMAADFATVASLAQSGRLRMLAAAGSKRTHAAPELPTVAESGYPGYAVDAWFGLVSSIKTAPDILSKLTQAVRQIVQSPEVRSRFEQLGYDPIGNSAHEFEAMVRADIEKFARVIQAAGIQPIP
ncbi:MAG: tripartite tricarboxylate transporter substrate binding protein [Betaproteobacteria bacterium]